MGEEMTGLSHDERTMAETVATPPILDHTLTWAAINSGTGNLAGLSKVAGCLADAFAVLPGEVTLLDPAPVEKVDASGKLAAIEHGRHLMVKVRPNAARRVLLTGHMDTVFAAHHPFQTCDWLDDNTLHGPGTADMKGGLALMLAGLQAFEAMRPDLGYDVFIDSDEETGSLSSAAIIRQLAQGKLAALTYEPALPGGIMARARPGSGNFSAVINGRSAHAGRNPEDGRNAVVAAADLAMRLSAARRAGLSINPARIDGGGPDNMVPDLAILRFNIRPHSEADAAEANALIEKAVAEVSREQDVAIHVHGQFGRPPKSITPAAERLFTLVADASSALGEPLTWQDTGGVCDGNNIAACGVPVIDTMGARGGMIHTSDEFLQVDSLALRARLTAVVLHRLDREGLPR
jgi:glutamate carboxypeptidase